MSRRTPTRARPYLTVALEYLALSCTTLLAVDWAYGLWHVSLHNPIQPLDGDHLIFAYITKALGEHHLLHNPRAIAPFGLDYGDFDQPDILHQAIVIFIQLFVHDSFLAENLFYLFGFVLVTASAYFLLRRLGFSRLSSGIAALLYSLFTAHFLRGEGHLFLSVYWSVPLLIDLLIRIMNGSGSRPFRILAPVSIIPGAAGFYYCFFSLMFVSLADRKRTQSRSRQTHRRRNRAIRTQNRGSVSAQSAAPLADAPPHHRRLSRAAALAALKRKRERFARRRRLRGLPHPACLRRRRVSPPTPAPPSTRNSLRRRHPLRHQFPPGSMILQLPYVPYPESRTRNIDSYDPLRAYLFSSTLRGSSPTMRFRAGDAWPAALSSLPLPELLPQAIAAGYRGLYVDRFGYAGNRAALETQLRSALQSTPLKSPDRRHFFFNLTHVPDQWTRAAEQTKLLIPVWYRSGFYAEEHGLGPDPNSEWRWCSRREIMALYNLRPHNANVLVSLQALSGVSGHSVLTLHANAVSRQFSLTASPAPISLSLTLAPGGTAIEFSTNAPRLPVPGDPRDLHFRIEHVLVTEAGPPS